MLELVLIVFLVVAAARVASSENQSSVTWGGIALVLGLASLLIPLPFLRVLIAAFAWLVAFIAFKPAQV